MYEGDIPRAAGEMAELWGMYLKPPKCTEEVELFIFTESFRERLVMDFTRITHTKGMDCMAWARDTACPE